MLARHPMKLPHFSGGFGFINTRSGRYRIRCRIWGFQVKRQSGLLSYSPFGSPMLADNPMRPVSIGLRPG